MNFWVTEVFDLGLGRRGTIRAQYLHVNFHTRFTISKTEGGGCGSGLWSSWVVLQLQTTEVLRSSSYSNWTDVERVDGKEVKLVGAGAAA